MAIKSLSTLTGLIDNYIRKLFDYIDNTPAAETVNATKLQGQGVDDLRNAVTKTSVGLENVPNFGPATETDARGLISENTLLTPKTMASAFNQKLGAVYANEGDLLYSTDTGYTFDKLFNPLAIVINQSELDAQLQTEESFEDVFSTWTRIAHLDGKQAINSQYIAYDTLTPPNPFIGVTQDNKGKVVYDGGFPKMYNTHAPASGSLTFNELSGTFKYLYNAFNWIANKDLLDVGVRKMLVLGDKPLSISSYRVKGTASTDFSISLTRLAQIANFEIVIKDTDDYGGYLNPTLEELSQYNFVMLVGSRFSGDPNILTDSAVNALESYRNQGGGIFIITDHGPTLSSEEEALANTGGFFSVVNKLALRFGVYFSGYVDRSNVNVGFLRTTYGDHPLYNNLLDTDTIYGGGSESSVVIVNEDINRWSFNPQDNQVYSTWDTDSMVGFISPKTYTDYVFEVRVSSTDADTGGIGLCFGFVEENNKQYVLTAMRTPGGLGPKLFDIYFNRGGDDQIDLGSVNGGLIWGDGNVNDAKVGPDATVDGWSSRPYGCHIRATRRGDLITLETSDLGGSEFVPTATVTVDLNSIPELGRFKGGVHVGYICQSQNAATWETVKSPGAVSAVVVLDDLTVHEWDGSQWITLPENSHLNYIQPGRFYHNGETGRLFYAEYPNKVIHVSG
jgi:hypothetical protein